MVMLTTNTWCQRSPRTHLLQAGQPPKRPHDLVHRVALDVHVAVGSSEAQPPQSLAAGHQLGQAP